MPASTHHSTSYWGFCSTLARFTAKPFSTLSTRRFPRAAYGRCLFIRYRPILLGFFAYCHLDVSAAADFETGIHQALQELVDQLYACRYRLPDGLPQPLDMSRLKPSLFRDNPEERRLVVPTSPNCPDGNGWYLESNEADYLVLCPNTCKVFRQTYNASLQSYGDCDSIILPQ